MNRYTLLFIKQAGDKDQFPYNTGKSTHHFQIICMGEVSESVYVHNWITWLYTWYLTHYCKSIILEYKIAIKCKKTVNHTQSCSFSSPQIYSCPWSEGPRSCLTMRLFWLYLPLGVLGMKPKFLILTYHFLLFLHRLIHSIFLPHFTCLHSCPTLRHWFLWKFSHIALFFLTLEW